jgi:chromosome segregation ATPase
VKPVEREPLPSSSVFVSSTELERISRYIRKIQIEHPYIPFEWDIHPPYRLTDVEMALNSLFNTFKSVNAAGLSWEKRAGKLEEKYKALEIKSKEELNRKNHGLAEWMSTTRKEKTRLETDLSAVRDALATRDRNHDSRVKEMQKDHESQTNAFLNDINELNKVLEGMRRTNSGLQTKVLTVENQLATIEQRHGKDMDAMIEVNELQVKRLKDDMALWVTQHEEEIRELKKDCREELILKKTGFSNDLARRDREHAANIKIIEADYRRGMQEKEEELRDVRDDLQAQLKRAEEQLNQAKDAKAKEIEGMWSLHAADKAQMETEHRKKISEKDEEVRGVREELHTQVKITEEQLGHAAEAKATEIEKIRKEHECVINAKAEEIERIQKEHQSEIVAMRVVRATERVEMEEGRARDTMRLRKDVEDLKGALLERDHSKSMSDREAARLFQDIVSEVDEFARVQWDVKYESTWPFPEKSLRMSENIRRAKQYIIQNTLWVILYEKIFCTPFRVLGDEGKSLEEQWIGEFGQGKVL